MNIGMNQDEIEAMEDIDDGSYLTNDIYAEDIGYNPYSIYFVCGLLFLLDILINVDHGALPSAAVNIKEELKMSNVSFGTLGSIVFAGLVSGSLCGAFMLDQFRYKTILILSFIGNSIGLLMLIMNDNYYCMCFSRFLCGFS